MSFALWKRSHDVHMDVTESIIRNWKMPYPRLDCGRLLRDLTRMARANEGRDVLAHVRPIVLFGGPLDGLLDRRVIPMME